MNSEKATVNHEAISRGWNYQIPRSSLDKLFGRSQALDIANTVLGGSIGFYPGILKKLGETPFYENKQLCEELLAKYQKEKIETLSGRTSEDGSYDIADTTVGSYQEFIEKLDERCVSLQSSSYGSRMRKKVIDIMRMRFLQQRRGNFVLVLDNEMLTFLIAMVTKGRKIKLEDMYKGFNSYGIFFNRGTRSAIEKYLLKLNLLDRKSDSGEAQYVKINL